MLAFGQLLCLDGKEIDRGWVKGPWLGGIFQSNPQVRPRDFQYFAEQGVEVKVISGDNLPTASEGQRRGSRMQKRRGCVRTLETEEDVKNGIAKYTGCSAMSPRTEAAVRGL